MTRPGQASFGLFAGVALVQGIHVIEHIIQLIQVYLLAIPENMALGLLGYVFQFQGTEEWLHLVFNVTFLLALYLLVAPLKRLTPRPVPAWAFGVFLIGTVASETCHVVEHIVIISNVIANNGCPCPGIGDVATGLSDTVLHFIYNAIAYGSLLGAFWYVAKARRHRTTELQPA